MKAVKEIQDEINQYFLHGGPSEFERRLNELNRFLIEAFAKEKGEAWLGRVNRYEEDRGKPYLVKYEGQKVYNFEYTFIVPCHDKELITLIKEREGAEYTGTCEDAPRVTKILDRIKELGGASLVWV